MPKRVGRAVLGLVAAMAASVAGLRGTQDAVANGDTRTLTLLHTHTGESATVTFRRQGRYDPEALEQLNWLLRDWRLDRPTKMDPRLFDIVWEVYREVGAREPVHILSAYRSPETNAMLRRRSRGVSEHSQHMLGKAMDFRLPDADMGRVRAIAMRLQHGGVGYYPSSGFVHLDSGSVRAWPRMTHDQLARLFPDGKTVHLPSRGKPLARYEEARAEIMARGGAVSGSAAEESAEPAPRRSLWATLFGGDDEDSEYYASRGRGLFGSRTASAYAPAQTDDSPLAALMGSAAPARQARRTQVAAAEPPAAPAAGRPFWQRERTPAVAPAQGAAVPSDNPVQTGALTAMPMPPPRPAEIVPPIVEVPRPPARPIELAALGVLPPPAPRSAPAPLAVTAPAPAPVAAPTPVAASSADDRAALRAFFAAAVTASPPAAPARPVPVTTSRTRPRAIDGQVLVADAGPALALGFSSRPTGDLSTTAFTGPAVKPLPVLP